MIALVLGGARSGKSSLAEQLVARLGAPVTYVATMDPRGDPELEERVAEHRDRRDPGWQTVEADDDLAATLASLTGTVLVDSLGPWVARFGGLAGGVDVTSLCAALRARSGDTVVVSDEVGLSVHPSTAEGRWFRDELGAVNTAVSGIADAAFLVVGGRALPLPTPGLPELPES
ncbi:MAG TPA: bifunctional adenosylcobinamide kinase/adenosylcobinamide-phosphate guanylyltransferase [Acidimicrobiales bacterium]|nr:bifunctional adenosylcobinamide kinase/adenosylcobinamide-phosphate guanylyltransferase [Acidimicrobiales bacterium]